MIERVGFDLHGVLHITENTAFFVHHWKMFLSHIRKYGHTVCIVSGPQILDVIAELNDLGYEHGVHYDEVYSVVSFLQENGFETWQAPNGHWWGHDKDWWKAKARICWKHHIGYMIDDSIGYEPYFTAMKIPFRLFENKDLIVFNRQL